MDDQTDAGRLGGSALNPPGIYRIVVKGKSHLPGTLIPEEAPWTSSLFGRKDKKGSASLAIGIFAVGLEFDAWYRCYLFENR
jgi:hypothetical protein